MTVSVSSLQKLMSLGLTTEQMAGVIDVLAVELAPLETLRVEAEERRSKDRERKRRGKSTETSEEKEKSPTPPKEKQPTNVGLTPIIPFSEPDGFEAFWEAYPKREGTRDRKGALKAFGPAVDRAGGHDVLVKAATRYAVHCREKGKIGTEFVKQARSWLNGDLWREWLPQELPPDVQSSRVYVMTGTDAMDAWDAYFKRTKGKMAPRDQRGGWWFDTEYPPQEQAA